MHSRDYKDEMWSRFVFELVICPHMNSTLGSVVPLAMFKSYPQILHEGTEVNNKIAEKFTQIQFDLRYRGAPKLGWHSDFSLDIEFSGASK